MTKFEIIQHKKGKLAEHKLSIVSMLNAEITGTLKAYIDEPTIEERAKIPCVAVPLDTLISIAKKAEMCSKESANFYGEVVKLWESDLQDDEI